MKVQGVNFQGSAARVETTFSWLSMLLQCRITQTTQRCNSATNCEEEPPAMLLGKLISNRKGELLTNFLHKEVLVFSEFAFASIFQRLPLPGMRYTESTSNHTEAAARCSSWEPERAKSWLPGASGNLIIQKGHPSPPRGSHGGCGFHSPLPGPALTGVTEGEPGALHISLVVQPA